MALPIYLTIFSKPLFLFQTCAVYWPDTSSTNFGPFNIEVVQKEDEVDVVTRVFKVQNIRKVGFFVARIGNHLIVTLQYVG